MHEPDSARELVRFARAQIRQQLGGPAAEPPRAACCCEHRAAFVTLRWPDGTLQGCIGNLIPRRPLVDEIAAHSVAAAFRDPRGRPLDLDDVDTLEVELSILSSLEPIVFRDEDAAHAALRPHLDGVALEWHGHRATFLPQMWSQLQTRKAFLGALKEKAGLAADFWKDDVRLWRYTVETFTDASPGG